MPAANSARIEAPSSGVTRSSASMHSTQSCRACATAKFFCGPKPSQPCSSTRAPQRCANATVSSRLPESTTMASAAKGTDARQSASSRAASRVMTMSDRGSGSDIRGRAAFGVSAAQRRHPGLAPDSTWFASMRDAAQRSAERRDERPAGRPPFVARRRRARACLDRRRRPRTTRAMPVDWVAEEAFVPLVRLDPRIRNVVPMAFRRWRGCAVRTAGHGASFAAFGARCAAKTTRSCSTCRSRSRAPS